MREPAKKLTMQSAQAGLVAARQRLRQDVASAIAHMRALAEVDPFEALDASEGDPRRVVDGADGVLRELCVALGSGSMPLVCKHCADRAGEYEHARQDADRRTRMVRAVAALTLGDDALVSGLDPDAMAHAAEYLGEREPLVAFLDQMSPEERRRLDEEVEAGVKFRGDLDLERAALVG